MTTRTRHRRFHLTSRLAVIAALASAAAGAQSEQTNTERTHPLRHALIVAADGTFLGTCDASTSTGVATPGGLYSSNLSHTSLFNTLSTYGAGQGLLSGTNAFTLTPPYLLSGSAALLDFFTNASYQPSAQVRAALARLNSTRITANTAFPLRLSVEQLARTCAAY